MNKRQNQKQRPREPEEESLPELDQESSDNDGDDIQEEETAQTWLFRHLIEKFSCDETVAHALLDGDQAPLINLLTSNDPNRALFITARKQKPFPREPVLVEALNDIHPTMYQKRKPRKTKNLKTETTVQRKSSKSPKQKKKPSKKKHKSKSPEKKKKETIIHTVKEDKPEVHQVEQKPEKVEEKKKKTNQVSFEHPEISGKSVVVHTELVLELVLEWWTEAEIPDIDHFMFIVPKTETTPENSLLDDLYHVGVVKSSRLLKKALDMAKSILEKMFTFDMKLDVLLAYVNIDDDRTPTRMRLERFVINTVIERFFEGHERRTRLDDSRSISLILQNSLTEYFKDQVTNPRPVLLMKLSFLDIDFLTEKTSFEITVPRLMEAMTDLRILYFTFKDTIEWVRQIFLYLLDLFSTFLAYHLSRKALMNSSVEDIPEDVCGVFGKLQMSMYSLAELIYSRPEDLAAVKNVQKSLRVLTVLEEEVKLIIQKAELFRDEHRDMAIHRDPINKAELIISQLVDYLTTNCLESAIESCNLDALNQLTEYLVKQHRQLENLATTLPEYH